MEASQPSQNSPLTRYVKLLTELNSAVDNGDLLRAGIGGLRCATFLESLQQQQQQEQQQQQQVKREDFPSIQLARQQDDITRSFAVAHSMRPKTSVAMKIRARSFLDIAEALQSSELFPLVNTQVCEPTFHAFDLSQMSQWNNSLSMKQPLPFLSPPPPTNALSAATSSLSSSKPFSSSPPTSQQSQQSPSLLTPVNYQPPSTPYVPHVSRPSVLAPRPQATVPPRSFVPPSTNARPPAHSVRPPPASNVRPTPQGNNYDPRGGGQTLLGNRAGSAGDFRKRAREVSAGRENMQDASRRGFAGGSGMNGSDGMREPKPEQKGGGGPVPTFKTGTDALFEEEARKFGQREAQHRLSMRRKFVSPTQPQQQAYEEPEVEQRPSWLIDDQSVEEFMEQEFTKIVGHDAIKHQLRQFHKKVQFDEIRASTRSGPASTKPDNRLYHMLFTGPPGTGKTTLAEVVGKVMTKMNLIKSAKVVQVQNALELVAGFAGQTPAKVDAKVEEARGGILFIDEAYSIVKSDKNDSFGREAIDTIMKHMDPPSCVFIFAGYEAQMAQFMQSNAGLARRVPYKYQFHSYSFAELMIILAKMCEAKGEQVAPEVWDQVGDMMQTIESHIRTEQNAGLVANWLHHSMIERDSRVPFTEAQQNPLLCCTLLAVDFERGLIKLRTSGH